MTKTSNVILDSEQYNTVQFDWYENRERPPINCTIQRVDRKAWQLFKDFHYMSAEIHTAARCFVLFVDESPASFLGVVNRPHPSARIMGGSRVVTLPDWQGLGLAMVLCEAVAAAYLRRYWLFHGYPAHPAWIHAFDRSPVWKMTQAPNSQIGNRGGKTTRMPWLLSRMRPCAVFEYVGPKSDRDDWLDKNV